MDSGWIAEFVRRPMKEVLDCYVGRMGKGKAVEILRKPTNEIAIECDEE